MSVTLGCVRRVAYCLEGGEGREVWSGRVNRRGTRKEIEREEIFKIEVCERCVSVSHGQIDR